MDRVGRAYGTKVVLKDISISYFYGAKIGVIGPNGSGKSSLFKILAGIDKDYTGETSLAPGYSIGYLEQEPYLEPGKTVMEIVKEGVKPITDLLAEFDKINEAFGDPDADFDKLCARQAEVQEQLDACDAWNLDNNLELAMEEGKLRSKLEKTCVNFGSMFIGHYSAEVLGDYAAGINHTLPTSGSAHFTGGLSVRMFLKTVTTLRVKEDKSGIFRSAAAAGFIGDVEGLAGHSRAARIRIEK